MQLDELNTLSDDAFATALGDVFEHSPWVAATVAAKRPFASLGALHAAMSGTVRTSDAETKLKLIRAHPDLAGKAARAGTLTADSAAEQSGAGLDRLTDAEFAEFQRLNDAYRAKFGIPFIVCVRRHGKESVLRQFERRLAHDRSTEIETALEEISRIVGLRLKQRVEAPDGLKVHGRLSTHVLDSREGRPAEGVPVELLELDGSGGRTVARAVTNADGRTDRPLIAGRPVPIARYELRFHVAAYFARRGVALADPPFLDLVALRFAVAAPEEHYHVPLLVTPWSYTTYRGS